MKWYENNPINSGRYLCAVKGYSYPILLYWRILPGGVGFWNDNDSSNNYNTKEPNVLYYMKLDDIPMPEGW